MLNSTLICVRALSTRLDHQQLANNRACVAVSVAAASACLCRERLARTSHFDQRGPP